MNETSLDLYFHWIIMKKLFAWVIISIFIFSWTYAWENRDYLLDTYWDEGEKYIEVVDKYTKKNRKDNTKLERLLKDIDTLKEQRSLETSTNPKYIKINAILNYIQERIATLKLSVKTGDNILVHYDGYLEDGEKFDSSFDREIPLNFEANLGYMIKGFDEWVLWMKIWDKKTIKILPQDWYGEYDEELVQTVEKSTLSSFEDAWYTLESWNSIPTQFWNVNILEVTDTHVTLDLNHELAWKVLIFEVELIHIN